MKSVKFEKLTFLT